MGLPLNSSTLKSYTIWQAQSTNSRARMSTKDAQSLSNKFASPTQLVTSKFSKIYPKGCSILSNNIGEIFIGLMFEPLQAILCEPDTVWELTFYVMSLSPW